MSLIQKTVLGIPITTPSEEIILEEIEKGLKKSIRGQGSGVRRKEKVITIFTPNPEIVMYAQKDERFKRIVASAQINIPDGWGICWALRRMHLLRANRISGVDFMEHLCQRSEEWGFRVGILGGSQNVALDARECLRSRLPRLEVEVMEAGEIEVSSIRYQVSSIRSKTKSASRMIPDTQYLIRVKKDGVDMDGGQYIAEFVKQIEQKDIRILFVALGFPKQEYFIEEIREHLSRSSLNHPVVLMAVGGSLDYISGHVPRAPLWVREHGGEWVWRLIREPWRLGRQIRGAEFFWRVLRS